MSPLVPPKSAPQAIRFVENILHDPKPFSTAEITTEIRTLFFMLQDLLRDLPQDQLDHLATVRAAMGAGDRKTLLREVPDVLNICKDAWQGVRLQYYNEVKRYLKFVHQNRRTPTLAECRALQLVPGKLAQYQTDLDRFLREGEGPEDLGPPEEEESDQVEDRREFISQAAERVAIEWGKTHREVNIPSLVIDGGYSFADAIAIAQWMTDHEMAPQSAMESNITDTIARGTTQALQSHQCPVCGHKLPLITPGDRSIICEECGFEVEKEE